jgi:hypothetical protein
VASAHKEEACAQVLFRTNMTVLAHNTKDLKPNSYFNLLIITLNVFTNDLVCCPVSEGSILLLTCHLNDREI